MSIPLKRIYLNADGSLERGRPPLLPSLVGIGGRMASFSFVGRLYPAPTCLALHSSFPRRD